MENLLNSIEGMATIAAIVGMVAITLKSLSINGKHKEK